MICDIEIETKVKGKVYRSVVRPAVVNGLETMAQNQKADLEVKDVEILFASDKDGKD